MKQIKTIEDVNKGVQELVTRHPPLAMAFSVVRETNTQIPLRLRPAGFGALAEIVISQLVSKASANAINERMISLIRPLTPQQFIDAGESVWRKIGLSHPKQNALLAVSRAILQNELNLAAIGTMKQDHAITHLTAIKGVGPWTAQVYLLFCVGHADIFPAGDVALREAVRSIFDQPKRPTIEELEIIAHQWAPLRGVAARLLWAYYAACKGRSSNLPV